MSEIEPTGTPATSTRFPLTSWAAFSNDAVTVQLLPPPKSSR